MEDFEKIPSYVMDFLLGYELPSPKAKKEMLQLFSEYGEKTDFMLVSSFGLSRREPVKRSSPLTQEEFVFYCGRKDQLLEIIFKGGITSTLRASLWKYLLLRYHMNDDARLEEVIKMRKDTDGRDYLKLKMIGTQTLTEEVKLKFPNLEKDLEQVKKDIERTDRDHPYFKEKNNPNITALSNILASYCVYNPRIGYAQGMSDLLSPILVVIKDEELAFWCFVEFINRVKDNLHVKGIKKQLQQIRTLLEVSDPDLFTYLNSQESDHMLFCVRWLIAFFKRDFSFNDTMTMWEVIWTDKPCKNFHLLICLALLDMEKDVILEKKYKGDEILKHFNEKANHINLEATLETAEGIYKQFTQCKDLPLKVVDLLGLKRPAALPSGDSGESASLEKSSDCGVSALSVETSPDSISDSTDASKPNAASMVREDGACHSPDNSGSTDSDSSFEIIN